MKYGFLALNLPHIQATTSTINTESWKVMERVGMRKEAHLVRLRYEPEISYVIGVET